MATAILQNVSSTIRLEVSVAWGANLTDITGASWTWSDITADVQLSGGWGINIQNGRTDESSTTNPSVLTLTLDNTSGAYSRGGQNTTNYPNVQLGTPVRVRVSTNSGSNWTVKYQGNAVGWTPHWDTSGRWATVTLTASGPLRQFAQGLPSPVTSAYRYWTLENRDSHLIGYWPLEDGVYASTAASAIGGTPATVTPDGFDNLGNSNAAGELFACAALMPNGGNFSGTIPSYSNSGVQQLMWLAAPGGGIQNNAASMFINTASGTIRSWTIGLLTGGNFAIYATTAANGGGTILYNSGTVTGAGYANARYLTSFTVTTSGSNVIAHFEIMKPDGTGYLHFQPTITGQSSGAVSSVAILAPSNSTGGPAMSVGHMTFRNSSTALSTYTTATSAYSGEAVTTRMTRLANDANVPLTIYTSANGETSTNPADTAGPQYADTIANLLRECEATEGGILFDGVNIGLGYLTRAARMSQQPALTVSATSGAVVMPFEPLFDDQNTVNQVTAQRRSGSSYTYTDTASANLIGIYSGSITTNPADDTGLPARAQWAVHVGSPGDGYRYPAWTFALEKQNSLIASWLTCTPGSRVDVTNVSSARSQHPTGTIRNALEGWRETISQHQWHVTVNTTSYEKWKVATLAAATGTTTDTLGRYESDGSTVTSSVSAGATSLSVTTPSGPMWTTSGVTADDFPLVVNINGNPITVTAISSTTSPQTFTVSAVPYAIAAGSAVTVWQNAVLGM